MLPAHFIMSNRCKLPNGCNEEQSLIENASFQHRQLQELTNKSNYKHLSKVAGNVKALAKAGTCCSSADTNAD